MRLFADACVARSLVSALRSAGHDVIYVAEGPPSVEDEDILVAALAEQRILLTEDHDFGALAVRDGRLSAGVVLIGLYGFSPAARDARVLMALGNDEATLRGQFTVIEPARTRVRPLRVI